MGASPPSDQNQNSEVKLNVAPTLQKQFSFMPEERAKPQLSVTKDSVVNPEEVEKEENKVSDEQVLDQDEEEFDVSDEDDSDENCEDSDENNPKMSTRNQRNSVPALE